MLTIGALKPYVPYYQPTTADLHEVIEKGHLDEACRFIASGTQFDLSKNDDVALLILAIKQDRLDIAAWLIEKGARVNGIKDGLTPLFWAIRKRNLAMAQLLLEKGADGLQLLLWAIHFKQLDMVQLLLDSGVNVNVVDAQGMTPLFKAIQEDSVNVVQMLIAKRANVNLADRCDISPLNLAVIDNREWIIQILLDARADVNAYDFLGCAPIHRAYKLRLMPIMRLLSQYGASWNLPRGHEISEMKFLAAAWGIAGEGEINGQMIQREGNGWRNPEILIIGKALQMLAPEIANSFIDSQLHPTMHLQEIQDGKLVTIVTGWRTHLIVLIFYGRYLAICNRGRAGPTKVYTIDRSRVTLELLTTINDMALQKDRSIAVHFLYTQLPQLLAASQSDPICYTLNHSRWRQKKQKHGFCAYNSPEAALFTCLALKTPETGGNMDTVKSIYKFYTTYFRIKFLHDYLDQIERGQIQKSAVDLGLLITIRCRLDDPTWHPERFANPPFNTDRGIALARLERVLLTC